MPARQRTSQQTAEHRSMTEGRHSSRSNEGIHEAMRTPVGSLAPLILSFLAVIYICSLSIQVVAIHKDFRFEVALGPLIAAYWSSDGGAQSPGEHTSTQEEGTFQQSDENLKDVKDTGNEYVKPERNVTNEAAVRASQIEFVKQRLKKLRKEKKIKGGLPPLHERAPAFMIIGAQKCGTQALRTYLSDHPNVVSTRKAPETHYFDKYYSPKHSPKQNLELYLQRSFHKDCRRNESNCISGESTPFYLYDTQHVPKRIKQVCPWTKFIVMLRDPVKRAFSQCSMLIDKNEINGSTFEQHLEGDLNRMIDVGLISNKTLTAEEEDKAWAEYQNHQKWRKAMIGRGFYEYQLRKWFEYFPREQFLIINGQDLDLNRTATMCRIYEFLGLSDFQIPLTDGKWIHRRKYKSFMPDKVQDFLYEFYRPYNQRLAQLLGPEWEGLWEKPETS